METKFVTLYDARSKPVKSLNTAVDGYVLPDNIVQELSNYRIDSNGMLICRGGMSAALGTVLATSSVRGSWSGFLWGSYAAVVAVYDGSKTRVYHSTDCVTWTELTAGSGPFGDTRLTGNGPVSFTVVPNPFEVPTVTNSERLLFTDGTGAVRGVANSYLQGGLTGQKAHLISAIDPQTVDDHPVRVRCIESTLLNLQGTPTFTVPSSGEFNFASSGSAPNKVARLTIDPTVDITDNVSVSVGTSSLAITDADRHVLIGVDTAYTMLWDKLKVEFGSDVLWDPATPGSYAAPIPVPVDNSNRTVWVFQYPTITAAGAKTGELKFTWASATNEAPASAVTADIFLLAMTYGTPGYSDWSIAVTNASTATLAESPGVIYSQYITDRISDYGGPILNGLKLPRSPLLKALYTAKVKNVSDAMLAAGVDSVRWYYKRPGDARYRYMGYDATASVSGSTWSFSSGTQYILLADKGAGPDSNLHEYPEVYLPDAYHIPPPACTCLSFANDRLFAGGAAGSTKNFYISANRNAFRFRSFTDRINGQVDVDDPVTRTVGSGVFQKIVPMSSSVLGADTVFIFTSEGVFVTGGNTSDQLQNVARVSTYGTVSPLSIATHDNSVIYLDTEMQIRILRGGQIVPVSRDWIDDNLAGIPAAYRKYASGVVHNERYYLAYTPDGATTNTRALVYSIEGSWMMDTPPKSIGGFLAWFDGTNIKKRLIAFGMDSTTVKAYEYDLLTQSQDLGTTNITCAVTFPEIHAQDGKSLFVNRIGVTCDDVSGSAGTITRTYKPLGSTGTSNLDMSGIGNQVVRYDSQQVLAGTMNQSTSAKVRLSLPLTAGKKIYKIVAELEPRGHAYDRSE